MYIVYKTDSWHSYASRDIIGLDTINELKCIDICQQQAEKEGELLTQDQLFNLANIKQTQGYSGEGEFQYERITENILL